jgi:probable lipoprotein NlpC
MRARARTVYDYRGWVRAGALRGGDPVEQARSYLGAPYLGGGLTERGIDCSGLVCTSGLSAYRPGPSRDAEQQEQAGTAVDEPRPGDLVTYGDKVAPDQSRFWLGGDRILHATGRNVRPDGRRGGACRL